MTDHLAVAWTVAQGLAEALLVGGVAVLFVYFLVVAFERIERERGR